MKKSKKQKIIYIYMYTLVVQTVLPLLQNDWWSHARGCVCQPKAICWFGGNFSFDATFETSFILYFHDTLTFEDTSCKSNSSFLLGPSLMTLTCHEKTKMFTLHVFIYRNASFWKEGEEESEVYCNLNKMFYRW